MQIVRPEETFIHPLWNGNIIDGNDIALLKLGIQSEHTPIRLPPGLNVVADGSQLQVLGWGYDGSLPTSPFLNQAPTIEIIARDICRSDDLWGSIIKDSMICGFGFQGEDFCKGDRSVLKNIVVACSCCKSDLMFILCCCTGFWHKLKPLYSTVLNIDALFVVC